MLIKGKNLMRLKEASLIDFCSMNT